MIRLYKVGFSDWLENWSDVADVLHAAMNNRSREDLLKQFVNDYEDLIHSEPPEFAKTVPYCDVSFWDSWGAMSTFYSVWRKILVLSGGRGN